MAGWGKFDILQMEKYRDRLRDMRADIPSFVTECVRDLAERLWNDAMARTPADADGLRNGWKIGQIRRSAGMFEVEVVNDDPEAAGMEYGHLAADGITWVAGRYMLTLSVLQLERDMPDILGDKLQQFMKRHME